MPSYPLPRRLLAALIVLLAIAAARPAVATPELQLFAAGTPTADGGVYSFGNASIGDRQSRWVILRNAGTSTLWIGDITFTGPYRLLGSRPTFIAAGAQSTLTVEWVPSGAGPNPGSIRIVNNDADENPYNVRFQATSDGLPPLPEISVFAAGTSVRDGGQYDFGFGEPGSPISRWITVRNSGSAPLSLGQPILTGPFSIVGSVPASVPAGQDINITVRWSPGPGGTDRGSISIPNNDSNENPFDLTLRGTSTASASNAEITVFVQGQAAADGAAIDFGSSPIGQTVQRQLVIRNIGPDLLRLETPSITGPFTLTSPLPTVIRSNSQYVTGIVWTPSATGSNAGELLIRSNDADENPFNLTLRGTASSGAGDQPEIALFISATQLQDGDTYDFGTTELGEDETVWLTLRNRGAATLRINAVTLTGPFSLDDDLPVTLAPQTDAVVVLRWRPTSPGTNTGTIRILNNDSDESQFDVALTGTAGLPGRQPEIAVFFDDNEIQNNGTFDFGVGLRRFSEIEFLTIRNTGDASLTIGRATFTGTFQLGVGFSDNVAPDSLHVAAIEWVPFGVGENVGSVTFPTNDLDENPFRINLRGFSVEPLPAPDGPMLPDPIAPAEQAAAPISTGEATVDLTGDAARLTLCWPQRTAGARSLVYLGTERALDGLDLVANTQDACVGPIAIDPSRTYTWRVDSLTAHGLVRGEPMTIQPARPCPADADRDGDADTDDLLLFSDQLATGDPAADLDHSGDIDAADLILFIEAWQTGCAPR